jgi:recombinational DNA repair ATPase RecF
MFPPEISVTLITPQHLKLIRDSPDERRAFGEW